MKNSKVLKGILILLGLNLTVLGSWRVIDPITFFEFSGLILSNDIGLLNEARAAGGAVAGFGLLILLGVINQKLSYTSTITAIVLYLGFGVARLISYTLDGNPGEMIMTGMTGEFVFGLIGVFALIKYREKS